MEYEEMSQLKILEYLYKMIEEEKSHWEDYK